MALSKFNGSVLAQAQLQAKKRRRRLVLLSSRQLHLFSAARPLSRPSLSRHRLPYTMLSFSEPAYDELSPSINRSTAHVTAEASINGPLNIKKALTTAGISSALSRKRSLSLGTAEVESLTPAHKRRRASEGDETLTPDTKARLTHELKSFAASSKHRVQRGDEALASRNGKFSSAEQSPIASDSEADFNSDHKDPLDHDHPSPPSHRASHLDPIAASVRQLQVPYVSTNATDETAPSQLVPCKSAAKRKLEDLLKSPINFVPATKATMSSEQSSSYERASKRRRVQSSDQAERQMSISHLGRDWPRDDLGATGMSNEDGVSCYRHSVLQTLMHIPIFVSWIRTHIQGGSARTSCRGAQCLACALRLVVEAYWPAQGTRRAYTVQQAVKYFDKATGQNGWRRRGQQCAHEYLLFVLATLEKPIDGKPAMLKEEYEALFGLKAQWQRTCMSCGHVETNDTLVEENIVVSLKEPRVGLTFAQYLEHSTFVYQLDQNNNIRCEGCGKMRHERNNRVLDGPEILVINMGRLGVDNWGRTTKVKDVVPFPLYLDLSKYCAGESMQRKGTLRYRLASLVQHWGSAGSGHYTAKVVTPRGIQLANDSTITSGGNIEYLLLPRDGGFLPYILTYVRVRAE